MLYKTFYLFRRSSRSILITTLSANILKIKKNSNTIVSPTYYSLGNYIIVFTVLCCTFFFNQAFKKHLTKNIVGQITLCPFGLHSTANAHNRLTVVRHLQVLLSSVFRQSICMPACDFQQPPHSRFHLYTVRNSFSTFILVTLQYKCNIG